MKRTPASRFGNEDTSSAAPLNTQPAPQDTQPEQRRHPAMLAAGVALLAMAAVFAAVMAADPLRPPTAGLDRWWLSVVTTWPAPPLARGGPVVRSVAGPWGG